MSPPALNVTGVVDGDSLTLTVFDTILPLGENFGGRVTSDGLSLSKPAKAGTHQTQISQFAVATLNEYDAAVGKLAAAGAVILGERKRKLEVEALDREAYALSRRLKEFVGDVRRMIEQQPRVADYYARAVPAQQSRLDLAARLTKGGASQRGQASGVIGQMRVDKFNISSASEGIDQKIQKITDKEAALTTEIRRFNGVCVGETQSVAADNAIPNMGACKKLIAEVSEYQVALAQWHSKRQPLVEAKAKNLEKLNAIWTAAFNLM